MLPARPPFARLEGFLRDTLGGGATRLHEEDAAPARTVGVTELGWSPAVARGFGFPQVYAHQAETYKLMRDGKHVIVTTPTASGKTGAFFPAVFDRLERDPNATALFVYPLVALGQDQRDKLLAFKEKGGFNWDIGAFQSSAQAADAFADVSDAVAFDPAAVADPADVSACALLRSASPFDRSASVLDRLASVADRSAEVPDCVAEAADADADASADSTCSRTWLTYSASSSIRGSNTIGG